MVSRSRVRSLLQPTHIENPSGGFLLRTDAKGAWLGSVAKNDALKISRLSNASAAESA